VLLTRAEEFQAWFAGSPDDVFAFARAYAPDRTRVSARSTPKASAVTSSGADAHHSDREHYFVAESTFSASML
jgi:hypothetical protein